MDGYWFKSDLFEIEPGEDKEINPGLFGRQLAACLKSQLEQRGYAIESVIAEDWGRCLVCSRESFMLWVGCGNVMGYETPPPGSPPPAAEDIVWHCFAEAEIPFWKRIFNRPDTAPAIDALNTALQAILESEPRITMVEQP